jgi:hypothetical protein
MSEIDAIDEWRRQVATAVRSVKLVQGPGGTCFFRAMMGMMALGHLGMRPRLASGSLIYRVGPHETFDCVALSGPGNVAAAPNMFHMWLEADGNIIDFACGDWRTSHIEALPPDSPYFEADGKLPPISWVIDPPEYIWRPVEELTRSSPRAEQDFVRASICCD